MRQKTRMRYITKNDMKINPLKYKHSLQMTWAHRKNRITVTTNQNTRSYNSKTKPYYQIYNSEKSSLHWHTSCFHLFQSVHCCWQLVQVVEPIMISRSRHKGAKHEKYTCRLIFEGAIVLFLLLVDKDIGFLFCTGAKFRCSEYVFIRRFTRSHSNPQNTEGISEVHSTNVVALSLSVIAESKSPKFTATYLPSSSWHSDSALPSHLWLCPNCYDNSHHTVRWRHHLS